MKNLIHRGKHIILMASIWIVSLPVFADMPKPPESDIPDSSHDAIDIFISISAKVLKFACIGVGAVVFLAAAGGLMNAYKTAQEKQDMGHFFKMGFVCLLVAAIGFGLSYFGYTIISNQS